MPHTRTTLIWLQLQQQRMQIHTLSDAIVQPEGIVTYYERTSSPSLLSRFFCLMMVSMRACNYSLACWLAGASKSYVPTPKITNKECHHIVMMAFYKPVSHLTITLPSQFTPSPLAILKSQEKAPSPGYRSTGPHLKCMTSRPLCWFWIICVPRRDLR